MAASNETKKGHEITCTLKLSDTSKKGWHKTISKVLKTIEGVSYSIDMENKKVTVMGNINPQALLSRLAKSGKHATLERVDSGALLQSRKAKLLKEKQKNEYLDYVATFGHPYQQYGYANANGAYSNYPRQYGYYSHSTGPAGYAGAGYPYGTAPDHYYGSGTQHPNNYYQHQQPYVPPAPPIGFPQPPPPPMDYNYPYHDSEPSGCTIM